MARLLNTDPVTYHQLPGFSASIAAELIKRSERHAKLKRDTARDLTTMTDEMIRGAVLHHLILGSGDRFEPCPFKDYKTDAAKKTRDNYFAAGIIPVLTHKLEKYEAAAKAIKAQLADVGIDLSGQSEVAIEWDEDGLLCRGMLDHVNGPRTFELKITDDVNPDRIASHAENMKWRIACAAYIRARLALQPDLVGKLSFTYIFAEPEPPYAVFCPDPDPPFIELGERDWLNAVRRWKACEATGVYPHYQQYQSLSPPRWKLRQEGIPTDEW